MFFGSGNGNQPKHRSVSKPTRQRSEEDELEIDDPELDAEDEIAAKARPSYEVMVEEIAIAAFGKAGPEELEKAEAVAKIVMKSRHIQNLQVPAPEFRMYSPD